MGKIKTLLLIFAFLILGGFITIQIVFREKGLEGKAILILVEDGVDDFEYIYTKSILGLYGADVWVLGPKERKYKGKHGLPLKADLGIDNLEWQNIHALVIPGGSAPEKLKRNEEVLELVKQIHKNGKILAAICHGPQVLAAAGILTGRKATGYSGIMEELERAGTIYLDQRVVEDGNLITSRHPGDLVAFCRAIYDRLKVK